MPGPKLAVSHEQGPDAGVQTSGINYAALYDMSISPDPATQKFAQQAAKNLTPDEAKEFFDFQQHAHEEDRPSTKSGDSMLSIEPGITGGPDRIDITPEMLRERIPHADRAMKG